MIASSPHRRTIVVNFPHIYDATRTEAGNARRGSALPRCHSSVSQFRSAWQGSRGNFGDSCGRVQAAATNTVRAERSNSPSATASIMMEYFHLLDIAERESTPLNQRVGILDIISRMLIYATPEQYQRYQSISAEVRSRLRNTIHHSAQCQK